jgi:hypothetical protein
MIRQYPPAPLLIVWETYSEEQMKGIPTVFSMRGIYGGKRIWKAGILHQQFYLKMVFLPVNKASRYILQDG